jgi:hypothetical protein
MKATKIPCASQEQGAQTHWYRSTTCTSQIWILGEQAGHLVDSSDHDAERDEKAYREIMSIPRQALTGMRIPPEPNQLLALATA